MLQKFKITNRWPATRPDVIQLYSLPTPNGVKVSAMLEETGLDYEPHLVNFGTDDQFTPEFLSLNPNNKIPAIIDPNGPNGAPLGLWESGAILIYLAEKSGKFLSTDPAQRAETLQWLMWQMGGLGPMLGQFGFFHAYAGKEIDDKRPRDRYLNEGKRLLGVLDQRLDGQRHIMGDDYTIADIATWPWIRAIMTGYDAADEMELSNFSNVMEWFDRCWSRPASQAAVTIPARP
ncbi:glutathione S-transferase N-terminal domain-containing protein [Aliiroseovarius crassostreae]|uniref:glutathione S-transferase N-terminal domain-containing protein n=1 Tax=Aliiroseovarius crassostreae TaxID=154981 RepID=UPI0021AE7209|nr:glutathione S-transferase N-terminal domain-containing protein [Aliiroseovarius crassostreae]UWP89926.1 glutathione S-transferase N-terminal domain-containing protein [Aliiroseovarius crassostreae]UWP99381.1 glutathione S-transferase N-terminal domain-containing protein [Aliiroseovarius crassostreae]